MFEKIIEVLKILAIIFVGSIMISMLLGISTVECTCALGSLFILVFMIVYVIVKLVDYFMD